MKSFISHLYLNSNEKGAKVKPKNHKKKMLKVRYIRCLNLCENTFPRDSERFCEVYENSSKENQKLLKFDWSGYGD